MEMNRYDIPTPHLDDYVKENCNKPVYDLISCFLNHVHIADGQAESTVSIQELCKVCNSPDLSTLKELLLDGFTITVFLRDASDKAAPYKLQPIFADMISDPDGTTITVHFNPALTPFISNMRS